MEALSEASAAVRFERVSAASTPELVRYAIAHGPEHDDSYTSAEEMRGFDPEAEIAVLARDAEGVVVGAGSLMVSGYSTAGTGRFRILYAARPELYPPLLDAVLGQAPAEVGRVIGFFFEGAPAIATLRALGFAPSRYAIVLRRPDLQVARPEFPTGVTARPARPKTDAEEWAHVINAAFGGFPDRFDMTAEKAAERLGDERLLPGGALIAWRGGEPVGLVAVAEYEEDGGQVVWVDQLAVVPGAQHQGVGRALLRAAIGVSRAAGFSTVDLSTGQTNERALALYTGEGFAEIRRVVCLARRRGAAGGSQPAADDGRL